MANLKIGRIGAKHDKKNGIFEAIIENVEVAIDKKHDSNKTKAINSSKNSQKFIEKK